MTFSELISKRYSVRAYEPRPVEDDKLRAVLDAGRRAPSACNFQPWTFIVVRTPEGRERLRAAYGKDWFVNAPTIIVVCCDNERAWKRSDAKKYGDVDMAIAMDHMILQATALDLGTCWIGAFNEKAAREALGLPFNIEPVLMTPLGYPAQPQPAQQRRSLDDVVRWERY
jgi:nitroreductase